MPIILAKDLSAPKAAARAAIDQAAEAARQKHLTEGSGQALVYQAKQAQAAAFLAKYPTDPGTPADAALYPLLQAEAGITAPTLFGVAQAVSAMAGQWMTLAAGIEKTRLAAKAAINAAATETAIAAAVTAASWP